MIVWVVCYISEVMGKLFGVCDLSFKKKRVDRLE